MSTHKKAKHPTRKADHDSGFLKTLMSVIGLTVILSATLFLSAGRLDWVIAWVYMGARVGVAAVSMFMISSKYPGLLDERFQPGEGVEVWDKALSSITTILLIITLIMAGLDMRFGWSPLIPTAIQLVALAIWLLGDVFSKWGAVSNRFYSRIVRIQKDRNHTVVKDGPYRYVRHPGYAGALVAGFATPFVLSSLWALVPIGTMTFLLVIRTALEDKTLLEELPGYTEYAQETRYRLVPGVW